MQYQRGEGEDICTWAQRGTYTVNFYRHKEDNSQWTEGSAPLSDTSAGSLWEHAGESAAVSLEPPAAFPQKGFTLRHWSASKQNTEGEDSSSLRQ